MAAFLTPEWIDELAASAASVAPGTGIEMSLEQRVTGPPDVVWVVELAGGRVDVTAGPHRDPTVRLTIDRATAEAIHAGRKSAQRAFLDGDLEIGGDIGALLTHRRALAVVGELLAGVT